VSDPWNEYLLSKEDVETKMRALVKFADDAERVTDDFTEKGGAIPDFRSTYDKIGESELKATQS